MSKPQITDVELAIAKKEHDKRKSERKRIYLRLFRFTLAVGNFAVASFLTILNTDPQYGHYVLGVVAGISALTFTYKLIWE